MDIEQYINKHLILEIGCNVPGNLYTDIIVDDPIGLIKAMIDSQYYISGVLWWERTSKGLLPRLGAGGVADPRCPDSFFFAETAICEEFERSINKQELLHYIQKIKLSYPDLSLYPSFDIAFR